MSVQKLDEVIKDELEANDNGDEESEESKLDNNSFDSLGLNKEERCYFNKMDEDESNDSADESIDSFKQIHATTDIAKPTIGEGLQIFT